MSGDTLDARAVSARAQPRLSPGLVMLCVMVLCIGAGALTVSIATSRAWLGLHLTAGAGDGVIIGDLDLGGPARGIDVAPGLRLTAIGLGGGTAGDAPVALHGGDLVEEPDGLDSYAAVETFLERQSMFADLLNQSALRLYLTNDVTGKRGSSRFIRATVPSGRFLQYSGSS